MSAGLSEYARRFLNDEAAARRSLEGPVMIWEAASTAEVDPRVVLQTRAGFAARRPRSGEPLVFEVKKGTHKGNAFAMGITVGRTETNDIPLEDESVSRFHAWLASDGKGWKLVDAESRNGTWLGALKLIPNKAEPLGDGARVRFGDVELRFLSPEAFFVHLQTLLGQ